MDTQPLSNRTSHDSEVRHHSLTPLSGPPGTIIETCTLRTLRDQSREQTEDFTVKLNSQISQDLAQRVLKGIMGGVPAIASQLQCHELLAVFVAN